MIGEVLSPVGGLFIQPVTRLFSHAARAGIDCLSNCRSWNQMKIWFQLALVRVEFFKPLPIAEGAFFLRISYTSEWDLGRVGITILVEAAWIRGGRRQDSGHWH